MLVERLTVSEYDITKKACFTERGYHIMFKNSDIFKIHKNNYFSCWLVG